MKSNFIISLAFFALLGKINAQAPILTWSVGEVNLDCENNRICYKISAQANRPNTQLADATKRYFYDVRILSNPTITNIQNGYLVTFSTGTNPTRPLIGDELGFLSDTAAFLRIDVTPNNVNLIQVGNGAAAPVFDLCFDVRSVVNTTGICAPFIFNVNHKQKFQDPAGTTPWPQWSAVGGPQPAPNNPGGIQWDFGYLTGDAGIATQLYFDNNTGALLAADD
nr:hypothetical protein [Saprospiraceae bacterium]